jgi:hypothetical protein
LPYADINNYHGSLILGMNQLYISPSEFVFNQTGENPFRLLLFGHFFYNTKPKFIFSTGNYYLLANYPEEKSEPSKEAINLLSLALDDLRRAEILEQKMDEKASN